MRSRRATEDGVHFSRERSIKASSVLFISRNTARPFEKRTHKERAENKNVREVAPSRGDEDGKVGVSLFPDAEMTSSTTSRRRHRCGNGKIFFPLLSPTALPNVPGPRASYPLGGGRSQGRSTSALFGAGYQSLSSYFLLATLSLTSYISFSSFAFSFPSLCTPFSVDDYPA